MSKHFTILIDRDVMWKYFTYYKLQHPKARTFPFARKITEKLFNKDKTPQLTKGGKHRTKSRNRKLSEISKEDMIFSVLSLNDLLPIDSMKYKTMKIKWGELGSFLAKVNKLENKLYKSVVVEYRIYSDTRAKKDVDNLIGASKILNDALFVGSKMLEDDNYTILNPFLGSAHYDCDWPRCEIRISVVDEEIDDIYEKLQIHMDNFKIYEKEEEDL